MRHSAGPWNNGSTSEVIPAPLCSWKMRQPGRATSTISSLRQCWPVMFSESMADLTEDVRIDVEVERLHFS